MWVFKGKVKEKDLVYSVGFYRPDSKFVEAFRLFDADEALNLVSTLNGGMNARYKIEIKEIMEDMCAAIEAIKKILEEKYD